MQIVVKKSPYEMLAGIGLDTNQIRRVKLAIGTAVKESFKERAEEMSAPEIERRTDYCFREALKLYCDYDFTVREIERDLATSLRLHLIGIEYQPNARLLEKRNELIT